ncbi:MAG TPA: phosphoribosylformylglycinamidine synthase subunit PurQ [Thermodesulfobacteriota bacterium]|nr:phosphoribosylformylglycinamidine synthase subunit PurQ [Thermodesulfobacteriota bacterium]
MSDVEGGDVPDGRHLAMMPHPERSFLKWQWPWLPESMKEGITESPRIQMFQNARGWCDGVEFGAKKIRKKKESSK